MAKNIVIAEGGTAKNFTAKKLQTNLQGSGRVNWIPEDEAVDYVDIKDHTFRAAGTFKPEDFNCDGFGEVTIDIPADVKTKTITKNGEFYAADDGCLGYSKVTVAVPTGGGGGPYTVRFFGDDYETILKTQVNVPYGGSATCTDLDGTVLNGLYFKGWNPNPINVKADMNCYPTRGDYEISSGEIEDDWAAICAVKGAGYPLGSYKALVFSVPSQQISFEMTSGNGKKKTFTETISSFNVQMHMVKVAEGEDGSTSSWMSTGGIYISSNNGNYMPWMCLPVLPADGEWSQTQVDWGNMYFPTYLDTHFLSQMPQCLQDSIVDVNKYYTGYASYSFGATTKVEKSRINKIWVPSAKEMTTYFTGKSCGIYPYQSSGWGYFSAVQEQHGIDYTAVYVPTYTQGTGDRELGFRTSMVISSNKQQWQWHPSYISIIADNQSTTYRASDRVSYWPFGFCLGGGSSN